MIWFWLLKALPTDNSVEGDRPTWTSTDENNYGGRMTVSLIGDNVPGGKTRCKKLD